MVITPSATHTTNPKQPQHENIHLRKSKQLRDEIPLTYLHLHAERPIPMNHLTLQNRADIVIDVAVVLGQGLDVDITGGKGDGDPLVLELSTDAGQIHFLLHTASEGLSPSAAELAALDRVIQGFQEFRTRVGGEEPAAVAGHAHGEVADPMEQTPSEIKGTTS